MTQLTGMEKAGEMRPLLLQGRSSLQRSDAHSVLLDSDATRAGDATQAHKGLGVKMQVYYLTIKCYLSNEPGIRLGLTQLAKVVYQKAAW